MHSFLHSPLHSRQINTNIWSSLSSWQRSSNQACKSHLWQQHRFYVQKHKATPSRSSPGPSRTPNRAPSANPTRKDASGSTATEASIAEAAYSAQHMQETMRGDVNVAAARAKLMGVELWGQKFPMMDLMIPNKLSSKGLRSRNPDAPSWRIPRLYLGALGENWRNGWQNFLSMMRLADEYAFPNNPARTKQQTGKWSLQLFKGTSTDETAWIAPMRRDMLEVYKRVCAGIANNNERAIKSLTAYEFQAQALKTARKSPSTIKRVWTFHGEASPCKVVSLRSMPAHMGSAPPATGCRLLIQALVRFDTWQSLTNVSPKSSTPQKKRVIEYLVMENRLYNTDGWYVRDQMYEGVRGTFTKVD